MDNKKAITKLLAIIENYPIVKEEKEAVLKAVGVLDWVEHGQKRAISILKKKKARETKKD